MKRFYTPILLAVAFGQFATLCWITFGQGLSFKDFVMISRLRSHPTIPPPVIDCSFDQAIYSADMDKIFCVRGQYLYQLDNSGALESQVRYATNVWGDSSLVELGDSLYIAAWRGIIEGETVSYTQKTRDIYKINRTNLTTTAVLGLPTIRSFASGTLSAGLNGFKQIETDGTNLWGFYQSQNPFKVDPGTPSGITLFTHSGMFEPDSYAQMALDTNRGYVWLAQPSAQNLALAGMDENTSFNKGHILSPFYGPTGIVWVPGLTNLYGVNGGTNVLKINGSAAYYGGAKVVLTNNPVTGDSLTFSIWGDTPITRVWTNDPTADTTTFIQTTDTVAHAASQLNAHLTAHLPTHVASHSIDSGTNVYIQATAGYVLSPVVGGMSSGGTWADLQNSEFLVNFAMSTVALTNSSLATAHPIRIRYRSSDGKLYIPTWEADSVVILDPTTDTVSDIKTGFSSPCDVVFTGSKAFAIQQSSLGIKEIQ